MNFKPREYQTKQSKSILIREAIAEDNQLLLKLKHQYLKATDTIPLFDYEYTNTSQKEKELILKLKESSNSLLLVAAYEGSLIGNLDLTGSLRKKMEHTGVIGMGIHTQWQNQGIGTLLIQSAIDWAKANKILKTIWLEVYATNSAGIALYKKMGFQESGRIKNFFLEKEKYVDKISMVIEVS